MSLPSGVVESPSRRDAGRKVDFVNWAALWFEFVRLAGQANERNSTTRRNNEDKLSWRANVFRAFNLFALPTPTLSHFLLRCVCVNSLHRERVSCVCIGHFKAGSIRADVAASSMRTARRHFGRAGQSPKVDRFVRRMVASSQPNHGAIWAPKRGAN